MVRNTCTNEKMEVLGVGSLRRYEFHATCGYMHEDVMLVELRKHQMLLALTCLTVRPLAPTGSVPI